MDMDLRVPNLSGILASGVPPEAMAFYGRWWQLERWLRELVYVELRAKYGAGWTAHLEGRTPKRAASDQANSYMASADADDLLAYADVYDLFALIDDQWELFRPFLPPQRRWQGTSDELRELRNRNAHCRRPHRDDLSRIEQALRDLENGAWRFYASYLKTESVEKSRDPLVKDWIQQKHPAASRLIEHAQRQYGVSFDLSYTTRPWTTLPNKNTLSGSQGVLWHASWVISGRNVNVARLWNEIERRSFRSALLVHLLFDIGGVTATFAAIDDAKQVSNTIGDVFDAILVSSKRPTTNQSDDAWEAQWLQGAQNLPARVQVNSPLTLVDPYETKHLSIFAADR